jgi:hypothetical protein
MPGRVMPSCTMARGRPETLIFGRDANTRLAPPPIKRTVGRPAAPDG